MLQFQTSLLFPTHAVPAPGPLPPGAERISTKAATGETLWGVQVPPAGKQSGDRTLILGFGGNAWNGEDVAAYLHEIYPEAHVVAFHYRGYRPSSGSPSAEALLADAPLIYDFAVGRIKPARTVAVGFSIGSGVAARLAAERTLDGLILVTPFDSLRAAAQSLYPWVPIGPFFQHEIDAAASLEKSKVPVAIIAGERDDLIVPARTAALRTRCGNLVFDRTIAGAGHNDIYGRSDFLAALREARDRLIS